MRDAPCISIYGRRGSGKSTRAKALIERARRVVTFDPMGEYVRDLGFTACQTVADIRAAMKADPRGFRAALVPAGDFPRRLHNLAAFLWEAQAGRASRLTLVVEEANLGLPNTKLPAGLDGMMRLTLQGRHREIAILAISQRPALVSADFRGQVSEMYIFALPSALDLQVIGREIGREHEAAIRALQPHEYIHVAAGQVRKGRNTVAALPRGRKKT